MITALFLAVVLAYPGTEAPLPVGNMVKYAVSPVMKDRALTGLSVEIRFDGDPDGETLLHLPNQWAGSSELWRDLSDFEVHGAAEVRENGPADRILLHQPGAPLIVRYRVRSPYTGDPGFDFDKARPLILPGWFFFHGEGVFATPGDRQRVPAQFSWQGFPAGWKVASDLEHLSRLRPGTVEDVVESVSIGAPDLQILDRDIDGARLRIATRGTWEFTPETFAGMVEKIVRTENELWGVPARPFFVPLAPLGKVESGHSFSGTGRDDAFSVAATSGFELGAGARLLAHEYMHIWFPGELGGAPGQDEQLTYWFGEGFTDFYAGHVLLRAGLWSISEYVDDLNRTLMRYGISPARNATSADVLRGFWTNQDVQKLPYDQGHLLAHLLSYRIRKAGEGRAGLHDVLRLQHTRAQRNKAEGRPIPGAILFPSLLRETTGLDIAPDLARYVEAGQTVELPTDLLGGCYTVTTVTQPEFHRGFDADATQQAGGILTGVDPESPAHAAGMRNGMRLIRRESGTVGDSSVEVAYRVKDGETERMIRYKPEGKGTVTFQRVIPVPEKATAECEQRMRAVP